MRSHSKAAERTSFTATQQPGDGGFHTRQEKAWRDYRLVGGKVSPRAGALCDIRMSFFHLGGSLTFMTKLKSVFLSSSYSQQHGSISMPICFYNLLLTAETNHALVLKTRKIQIRSHNADIFVCNQLEFMS